MTHKMHIAVINIPEHVKHLGKEVATSLAAYSPEPYETIVTNLMCEWAVSKHLCSRGLHHEWGGYPGAGFTSRMKLVGAELTFKVVSQYSDGGFNAAVDGIRISHYDIVLDDVDFYVCTGYDGTAVYIVGTAAGSFIQRAADVFEKRPLIYNLPAERVPNTVEFFAERLQEAGEKQIPLDGFLINN